MIDSEAGLITLRDFIAVAFAVLMNGHRTILALFAALAAAAHASMLFAANEKQGPIFAITEENDIFSNPFSADHTDRHYTQGLRFTYLGSDDEMPGWVSRAADTVPTWAMNANARNLGFVLGQDIYTPQDLTDSQPIPNDRPYGGWLYVGAVFQRRGTVGSIQVPVEEDFELDLGITGKASTADICQQNFHRWFFHSEIPKGWHNQLSNEPGLLLKYQRLWRTSFNEETGRYVDFIPHVGGEAGNVEVYANLGGTFRVGYNLPRDFGVPLIDSPASINGGTTPQSPPFGFYIFGGVDGRYVAHNLFLDGNTFLGSMSVNRVPWVADLICGGAIQIGRHFELSYQRVTRTLEFDGQSNADIFGSITAKAEFSF